jgi:putative ABC transport system substrate-binding protein
MRRREFIALLGGTAMAAGARPFAACAQAGPMRRVGVLMPIAQGDPIGPPRVAAFQQRLQTLGWTEGRNIRIDYRWGAGDIERERIFATELVGLRPDVLLAAGTPELAALRRATRTIPIVFNTVGDPVGGGFVASLGHPGGNITGFTTVEPPLAGKWVQLLKTIAPGLRRAAFLFDPEVAPYAGEFFRHAEAAAAPLMLELTAAAVRDDDEVEDALANLARASNAGLIVNGDAFTAVHRERIIAVATRYRLPAVYPFRFDATDGGLLSYGIDPVEPFRQAATYVDRVLRGDKPADLPVQAPTKFELIVNLKTARAIGLNVSPDLLSIADEVIE